MIVGKIKFGNFFNTGRTLATFSIVGKRPVYNQILNISARWLEISFLNKFNITGMLLGTTDLFESSKDIIFCISDWLSAIRKRVLISLF